MHVWGGDGGAVTDGLGGVLVGLGGSVVCSIDLHRDEYVHIYSREGEGGLLSSWLV